MLLRLLYSFLFSLALPLVFLRLLWRSRKDAGYRSGWLSRLGLSFTSDGRPLIWVHAVSLGETVAIVSLVRNLVSRFPDHRVLVTSMTLTGVRQARKDLSDLAECQFVPYDLPWIIGPVIRKTRPSVLILAETELWPNLLHFCRKYDVPVLVANARLNPSSARRYARAKRLGLDLIAQVTAYGVQSPMDLNRFKDAGVPVSRLVLTGNLKSDREVPTDQIELTHSWRSHIGDRPVWIAASTHDAEEDILLQAHRELSVTEPDLLLIIVPRHPERFDVVARKLEQQKWRFCRHSEQRFPEVNHQIWLGDTMGNLFAYYGLAKIAFVGGSLARVGGHSPIEPAALGLPIVMGPHVYKCQQIHDELAETGCLFPVDDRTLNRTLADLLDNDARRAKASEAAKNWLAINQGATERHLDLISQSMLPVNSALADD